MSERSGRGRSWAALAALLGVAVATGVACSSSQVLDVEFLGDPYQLGGQTGSLLPRCGVAPLSAGGQSVPAGRAIGVFYGEDCRELLASGSVALLGAGVDELALQLVPLAEDTYLLQAPESVPAGDYRLALDAEESTVLSVVEGDPEVPRVFGALAVAESGSGEAAECPALLRFTLELDDAALALTPLARFELSLDGGEQQLWVDYGALRIEQDESGSRGVLELPRCGARGCVSAGLHQLRLQVRIAGASSDPEPIELDFEPCSLPASESSGEPGCALRAPRQPAGAARSPGLLLAALVLGWSWRRASSRRGAR